MTGILPNETEKIIILYFVKVLYRKKKFLNTKSYFIITATVDIVKCSAIDASCIFLLFAQWILHSRKKKGMEMSSKDSASNREIILIVIHSKIERKALKFLLNDRIKRQIFFRRRCCDSFYC